MVRKDPYRSLNLPLAEVVSAALALILEPCKQWKCCVLVGIR